MRIYILLTTPSTDAGPFNIYSDVDGFYAPFGFNVSKATLEAGYATDAPDGTTIVRLISVGECTNQIEVAVGGGPIPTTSTTTSTTTVNPFTWYYGTYNSPGGVVPIPTELDIDISTGTLITSVDPSGSIIVPFNSAVDDFLWFAIPQSANGKTNWFVTSLNQGLIGGPATYFGNLFPEPYQVVYNTVPMYLYISTGRTPVEEMIISGNVPITTTTSTTLPVPATELLISFTDISVAASLVGNPANVDDWNTFMDLPVSGNPFTSVYVSGNSVNLIGGSNIILSSNIFSNVLGIVSVDDQAGSIIEAGSNVFEDCTDLTTVNLSGLVIVDSDLFKGCVSLVSANLPVLIDAGNDMFEDCTSLTTVNLPQLQTVSFSTFNGCTSLVSIDLPSLTTSDYGLFSNCSSLTTVNLPQLVTLLDCCSFSNCTSLTTISLPNVESIPDTAFEGCTALTEISIPSCTQLGFDALDNLVFFNIIGNSITLTVPSALMTNNGGNPDGDIQYLQANNTVTIITV